MKRLFFIYIFCLAALQIQAAENITLEQAMQMAQQNSQKLKIDSLIIQSYDIQKKQVQNAMLPVVALQSSYSRLSDNIDPFEISIPGVGSYSIRTNIPNQFNNIASIQQPIFQGLRNWNTLKAVKEQKSAATFDMQKDVLDVKYMIVQTFYQLYKLQQAEILLDSNIAQTQARVDDLERFKNAGLILNNEVMRAELQKNSLQIALADTKSAIEIVNYNLCILLGIDTDTQIIVSPPDLVTATNATFQSMLTTSYSDRAELKAQTYRTKAADYGIKASRSAYMPTISAKGNAMYNNPNMRMFPPEEKFKATWDVGISISWNLMQLYTARSVVAEAKNKKAQLEQVTKQIKDGISIEVKSDYEALKVALLKIDLAKDAITQATENKRILDNRFNAQVALLTDVLEADQLLLKAQTDLLNAQADAAVANYKLQKSLGTIK